MRFRLRTDRNEIGRPGVMACLMVSIRETGSMGAGYLGGCTFYVGWNPGSRQWLRRHRNIRQFILRLGVTRNANKVPYCSH